ncbi:4-(cytidine 5'-diphospho)-2-C-methyl-D-erythritol kinase [Alloiococcus sp. CFN-8]|uniref:4-(cytidine 5'-diphospho)-2-C-methyl-D-erythritol kinase n=1 Tax=Alloiococcus sp. CFN-8 TaxID=3416081 RepID=UPI003CE77FE4
MIARAYAKINISLDVIGKREDGYHLLQMIMQQIDLYDNISVEKADNGIVLKTNRSYLPVDKSNLAYKAAELFMNNYNIGSGLTIEIEKNIPVSAGLAGGSTDAAAILMLLNRLFEVNAPQEELMELSLGLGADVPFCIKGGTALCENIGELITPLEPFKNHLLVLVKPPFGVSTKEVYKGIKLEKIHKHPDTERLIEAVENQDLSFVSHNMKNVLENVTLRKHNKIRTIKKKLMDNGALGAMMSGSGPSVFGFFDDILTAQKCYDAMKKEYKEVFLTRTI